MSVPKRYAGEALPTELTEDLDLVALSFQAQDLSGYPPQNFVVSLTDGLNVERILVSSRVANTGTVYGPGTDAAGIAFPSGRGFDGTDAKAWSAGAVIKHVFDADSATYFTERIAELRGDVDALASLEEVDPNTLWKPGDIKPTAAQTLGTGWLWCDGGAVSRTGYPALFAAVGTVFGTGNGSTTFNLPDLRGRFPLGANDMAGAPPTGNGRVEGTGRGAVGGEASHALDNNELSQHSHTASAGLMSADHSHHLSIASGGASIDHSHQVHIGSDGAGEHSHTPTEDWNFVIQGPPTTGNLAAAMDGGNRVVSEIHSTSADGWHAHAVNGDTWGQSIDHAHTTDGDTAGVSANHDHVITVDQYGLSMPHNTVPPYVGINYWIKT